MRVGEIEIRGHLTFTPHDPEARAYLAAAAAADVRPDYGIVHAEDVAAQLERFEREGVRVVLLTIASGGGACGAASIVYDAVRRFSEAGGRVVAYVETAGSGAADVAQAADYVVLHPDGKFLLHASYGRDGDDAEQRRRDNRDRSLERLSARTATPPGMLAEWLSVREDDRALHVVELRGLTAMAHGWADNLGSLDNARVLAQVVAIDGDTPTPRRVLLRARAEHRDDSRELAAFGACIASASPPLRTAYPRTGSAAPGCELHNVGSGAVGARLLSQPVADPIERSLNTVAVSSDGERAWYAGRRSSVNAGCPVLMDKAWTASTPYALGYRALRSGNVYACSVAGTSGATGPSGTGTNIVDGTARWDYVGTMASQERVLISTWRSHVSAGASYYLYSLKLTVQPRTMNDNLDGLRYAEVVVFEAGTADYRESAWVPIPDRKYASPLTDNDPANSVVIGHTWLGPQSSTFASGYLSGFVRIILHNSIGASMRDYSLGDGPSAVATGGVTITGSGTPPPAPTPPPPDGDPVGGECVAPESLIRTPEGGWTAAGALVVGDSVWTVPEGGDAWGAYRVVQAEPHERERVRVAFEDGRSVVCTPDHRWLAAGEWRESATLPPGIQIAGERAGIVRSVEPLGVGPIVLLTIDRAHTYQVDGFLCHNAKRLE